MVQEFQKLLEEPNQDPTCLAAEYDNEFEFVLHLMINLLAIQLLIDVYH